MSGRSNPDQPRYVTGHGIAHEGWPHTATGRRMQRGYGVGRYGAGHGKCVCGALSPEVLPSTSARKRWHVQHKADVLAARPCVPGETPEETRP